MGKNTLYGCSQSNYHLIHLAGIHSSYFIHFQVCNMLKILHERNRLNQSIFDFMKYLSCHVVAY